MVNLSQLVSIQWISKLCLKWTVLLFDAVDFGPQSLYFFVAQFLSLFAVIEFNHQFAWLFGKMIITRLYLHKTTFHDALLIRQLVVDLVTGMMNNFVIMNKFWIECIFQFFNGIPESNCQFVPSILHFRCWRCEGSVPGNWRNIPGADATLQLWPVLVSTRECLLRTLLSLWRSQFRSFSPGINK